MLRIGIDLDNTITRCPEFFAAMTQAMQDQSEIHVITDGDPEPDSEEEIKAELQELGIHYDYLAITAEKAHYILDRKITIFFDDTDEYFQGLPESVTVFKTREPGNFDFETHRWVYDNRTGRRLG